MFKRPDDPPEFNHLYALPAAAALAVYGAGHAAGALGVLGLSAGQQRAGCSVLPTVQPAGGGMAVSQLTASGLAGRSRAQRALFGADIGECASPLKSVRPIAAWRPASLALPSPFPPCWRQGMTRWRRCPTWPPLGSASAL